MNSTYAQSISKRIVTIMGNSGLTIPGFSQITGISESHIYALMNGNRDLTDAIADKLGKPFKLKGSQILRLDYELSENIIKSQDLIKFKRDFSGNLEYFITMKSNTASYYVEYELLDSGLFNARVYLWEVIQKLQEIGKAYSSKELSQILHYLVIKGKLKSEKKPIKLKSGGYGTRIVDVFYC